MARGDGMGPQNQGPKSGRGAGYCAGYNVPGFKNFNVGRGRGGRGLGRGFAQGGRGFGIGNYNAYPAPASNTWSNGPPK